jgi:hypothetical protein
MNAQHLLPAFRVPVVDRVHGSGEIIGRKEIMMLP